MLKLESHPSKALILLGKSFLGRFKLWAIDNQKHTLRLIYWIVVNDDNLLGLIVSRAQPHARLIAVLFDELDADAKLTMVGLHPGRGAFPEGNDRLDRQPTQP